MWHTATALYPWHLIKLILYYPQNGIIYSDNSGGTTVKYCWKPWNNICILDVRTCNNVVKGMLWSFWPVVAVWIIVFMNASTFCLSSACTGERTCMQWWNGIIFILFHWSIVGGGNAQGKIIEETASLQTYCNYHICQTLTHLLKMKWASLTFQRFNGNLPPSIKSKFIQPLFKTWRNHRGNALFNEVKCTIKT